VRFRTVIRIPNPMVCRIGNRRGFERLRRASSMQQCREPNYHPPGEGVESSPAKLRA
jgi:hypothetical protein